VSEPYDAVLIVSFGGPEGPEDIAPFLANVTRGRNIPAQRLAEVTQRIAGRGGVSPLGQVNRDLRVALEKELARDGHPLPVFVGNRNWHPYIAESLDEMRAAGVQRALAYVTSAYASYSSCRQYLDDIARARAEVGPGAPVVERLRHAFDHPGYVGPFVAATVDAIETLDPRVRRGAALCFTAHSIPRSMAASSGPDGGLYEAQLIATAALVAERVAVATGVVRHWELAWQSRSGPPGGSWLEPDISEVVSRTTAPALVAVPIGFTADHMEVLVDLDEVAASVAADRGLPFARAATPGCHPDYVAMIAELVRERIVPSTPRRALSPLGPSYDVCPEHCCPIRPG